MTAVAGIIVLSACTTSMPLVSNSGIRIDISSKEVHSMKDLNEMNIEMQKEDYSCGAASLATLMRYYFNEDINEKNVLDKVKDIFTEEQFEVIAERGLSFLELGQVSNALGFQSAGVRLTTKALHSLRGPVLVYVESAEYKHFAVFRGLYDNHAYLADPSRGNIRLPLKLFLEEWKGQALVLGKEGYGVPEEHKLAIVKTKPRSNAVIFRHIEEKLAPTQSALIGGIYGS